MSRLIAAIEGDLRQVVAAEVRGAERAVTRGIRAGTEGLKTDLRTQVTAAGLGPRLARTWRSRLYPEGETSVEAAGFVWSKAPRIVQAFYEGASIRSRSGFWLAIPTPAAPKRGVGGKRISPSTFPEHNLGKLRFVYRRNGPSLLVVDNLVARSGKRGGFRRASATAQRTGRGLATVVMFIMVPQVKLRKRLDIDRATLSWLARTTDLIIDNWQDVPVRRRR
jgi:hypothetical protein